MKTKVKVFGAGSLEVENYDARAILLHILTKLQELDGASVKEVKRGAPKKVKVISEGAAG